MKRSISISIIGFIAFFPILLLAFLSLSEQWMFPNILPDRLASGPWKLLLTGKSELLYSLLLSVGISLLVAVVVTIFSFFASRQIAYSPIGKKILWLTYFPYVFAPVLLGAILQYYFIRYGMSGKISGVLLGQFFITFPYGIIFFISFWNARIRSFEDLVSTLGGNPFQKYKQVLFPIARPAISLVFFQTFLISWFDYGLTMLIGIGQVQTLPIKVFQYVNSANMNHAAAASLLLILPPVILLWINKKYVLTRWQM
jgi:putative spermidine/putrescine transport system permease protein